MNKKRYVCPKCHEPENLLHAGYCSFKGVVRPMVETKGGHVDADDMARIFNWLNDAEKKADELYEIAKKAGAKGFEIQHPAHRIAGSLGALRNTMERIAGLPHNSTRDAEVKA